MIVWILFLAAFVLTTSKCEPPVNTYLPPTSETGSSTRPSSQYGPPGSNQGRSPDGFNPASSGLGNQPRESFNSAGINLSSPSAEYGVPGQGSGGFSRGGSRGSQTPQGSALSTEYGSPNQQGSNRAGNGHFRGSSQRPDSSYGTPSNGYQPSSGTGFNGINGGQGSRQPFGSPSSSYGTPDFGNDLNNRNQNYRGSGVNDSNEPAKYEFSYEVDDPNTGTRFGHSEQRDGDVTTGEYNVVLPDGRKQVVEYEADQEGYKPQIRYEGAGGGTGSGFGRGGAQGGKQGYPSAAGDVGDYSQSRGGPQDGRYQQSGFSQDSETSGYPSGRPGDRGFGNQGQGFPGGRGSSGYPSGGGNNFPGSQGVDGFASGPQGRGGSRGTNEGNDGYPRGGPDGPRGSGY